MPRPQRVALLIVLVVLALVPPAPAAAPGAPCADARVMPGVGTVCPRANGLYEMFDATGASLGFTHGTDPIPRGEPPGAGVAFGTTPTCVPSSATDYYVQVIYARATDDADGYAALTSSIRWLVGSANDAVDKAAIASSQRADLKVLCSGSVVSVANEVLPTPKASATFSTIVTDLRAKGYTNAHLKYWVYYDDTGACACGGTGHVYGDDTLAVTNANNGNAAAMFAVNFGYNSTRIWLHELGHNMGAVQLSAPHTTGSYHCVDGLDIMCYSDGGPTGSNYTTTWCSVEVFDCGKNDYFNAAPPAGSYLATHWNLGDRFNRFLNFGTPVMDLLSCPPVERGNPTVCTFRAGDDSAGVTYTLTWGDGASNTTSVVAPGVSQTASHTYAALGNYTVNVTATDDGSPPLTSAPKSTVASVVADPPPVMASLSCTSVELGRPTLCTYRANDDASLVDYSISWGDGVVTTTGPVAPNVTRTANHTYATTGNFTVNVSATTVGPYPVTSAARSASALVAYDLTPPTLTLVEPRAGFVYAGCSVVEPLAGAPPTFVTTGCVKANATDARSGVAYVRVSYEGRLIANLTVAPYTVEFPVTTSSNSRVDVLAVDAAGNSAAASVRVVAVGP